MMDTECTYRCARSKFKDLCVAYETLPPSCIPTVSGDMMESTDVDKLFAFDSYDAFPGGVGPEPADIDDNICAVPELTNWLYEFGEDAYAAYAQFLVHFSSVDHILQLYSEEGKFLRDEFFTDFDVVEDHKCAFETWFQNMLAIADTRSSHSSGNWNENEEDAMFPKAIDRERVTPLDCPTGKNGMQGSDTPQNVSQILSDLAQDNTDIHSTTGSLIPHKAQKCCGARPAIAGA